ncbi:PadR family transcriptional regulator [Bacillus timonensis]|nr:PadR family transcriptional regulator [Bacillus timonensis]
MSVEHAILSVISYRPCTGYDIKVEFEHKGAGLYWGMSFGSIYPRLKKLENEGLIKSTETETDGRQKKYYELTYKGLKVLEAWYLEQVDYPSIKDEFLLKMIGWTDTIPNGRSVLLSHVIERKKKTSELYEYVMKWPLNGYSTISEYAMLAIRHFQTRLRAELEWMDETIKQLQGPAQPPYQNPNGLFEKREHFLKKLAEEE